MSADNRMKSLQSKHAQIKVEIQEKINTQPAAELGDLKKTKLALKDEISKMQQEIQSLMPDTSLDSDSDNN